MNRLALALGVTGSLCLSIPLPLSPAAASVETVEARGAAASAAAVARGDMLDVFGTSDLAPGRYLWREVPEQAGAPRLVVSLSDQLAYLYRGSSLVAVSTISSGKSGHDTPTGIFSILEKKPMHRSRKYENAPMPHMQRIDDYGIALHAGHLPGYAASHGCVRLPAKFAAKLYGVTRVGSTVMIGA